VATRSWLGGYSAEEVKAAQKVDTDLGVLHQWMETSIPSTKEEVQLESQAVKHYWLCMPQVDKIQGVLYYRWEDHNSDSKRLLLVPKAMRDEILKFCHESPLAGHPGITRTKERVKQLFFWHGMAGDVERYVAKCPTCQKCKRENQTVRAPLQGYQSGEPLERVQLDILGPFPVSAKGNKYILVIMDQFTKWVEAFAVPNQEAETVSKTFVEEFILRYGVPIEVHTDQGKNFDSLLFKRICTLLNAAKTRTTPYHPSSNGLVERFNRTLLQMLRCYCDADQKDWDVHLPYLTAAYRSTPHTATCLTPNKLMFGREVHGPEALIHGVQAELSGKKDLPYLDFLEETLESAYEFTRKTLKQGQLKQKRLYDLRSKDKPFFKGDLVLVKDTTKSKGKSPKLQPVWKGPYIVSQVFGPVLYELRDRKGSKILHYDRLKKYHSEDIPYWVSRKRREITAECACPPIREETTDDLHDAETDTGTADSQDVEPQEHTPADEHIACNRDLPLEPQRHSEPQLKSTTRPPSLEPQRHSETQLKKPTRPPAAEEEPQYSSRGRLLRKPQKLTQ